MTSSDAAAVALLAERHEPDRGAAAFDAGDFILVKVRNWKAELIRWAQKTRFHGADRKYADWIHAALIVDQAGTLIEAVGTGVRKSSLAKYADHDYKIFRIQASDEDRRQVVNFAAWAEKHHASYGPITVVSIALTLLTGSKLTFFVDDQFVCSGLVACALERAGIIFPRSARHITPADLAKHFDATQSYPLAA